MNARLQREGARTGEITASLMWDCASDLDLHAKVKLDEGSEEHIHYNHLQGTGGALDVDANARELINEPVEHIYWSDPPAGEYKISVHNFRTRGDVSRVPFRAELSVFGDVKSFDGEVSSKEWVQCFRFTLRHGKVIFGELEKVSTSRVSPAALPVPAVKLPLRRSRSRARLQVLRRPSSNLGVLRRLTAPVVSKKPVSTVAGRKAEPARLTRSTSGHWTRGSGHEEVVEVPEAKASSTKRRVQKSPRKRASAVTDSSSSNPADPKASAQSSAPAPPRPARPVATTAPKARSKRQRLSRSTSGQWCRA